jgi:hypothetical protein
MLGAAAEAVLQPTSGWWGVVTPVWALTWAVLRKREKSAAGRDRDEEVPEEFGEAA